MIKGNFVNIELQLFNKDTTTLFSIDKHSWMTHHTQYYVPTPTYDPYDNLAFTKWIHISLTTT